MRTTRSVLYSKDTAQSRSPADQSIFIMRYDTIPFATLKLVSTAASTSVHIFSFPYFLRLTSSLTGLLHANWHHYRCHCNHAAAGEDTAYPQEGSNDVPAPIWQSGGISGDDDEDESYGAFPETSSAEDTAIPTEVRDSAGQSEE